MMRLTGCTFTGLQGFASLRLDELNSITVFTGPNGGGKSTILGVLHLALQILNEGSVCDRLPKHDAWVRFSNAVLQFSLGDWHDVKGLGGLFNANANSLEVSISCSAEKYEIRYLAFNADGIQFSEGQRTASELAALHAGKDELEASIASQKARINALAHDQGSRTQAQQQLLGMTPQLQAQEEEIERARKVQLRIANQDTNDIVDRGVVDQFIKSLGFPEVHYVDAKQLYDNAIPSLISKLMDQKRGRRQEHQKYKQAMDRLCHLLQSDVDVFEDNGAQVMTVNGATHNRASSGTQISLSFFGLTNLGDPKSIVLWDEPENGLHPTRRTRMLNLMFGDGRQFILATHAAEFAPVFEPTGRVYRCYSQFDSNDDHVALSVTPVINRRDAFIAMEALGVHPARTLFTANVVIWVEGPTELLFYRHWLRPRLELRGMHEGFHYSFMQYGGSLISYLEAADAGVFASTFDLMSLCRHPVIVVDSDLRAPPAIDHGKDFLKPGATRLWNQIEELNVERPNAALFQYTGGREVENYLPDAAILHAVKTVWRGHTEHANELSANPFTIGQYAAYDEVLETHFLDIGIKEDVPNQDGKVRAKGKSLWGSANKVEMMRSALDYPGLEEGSLQWGGINKLKEIEEFVVKKCGS